MLVNDFIADTRANRLGQLDSVRLAWSWKETRRLKVSPAHRIGLFCGAKWSNIREIEQAASVKVFQISNKEEFDICAESRSKLDNARTLLDALAARVGCEFEVVRRRLPGTMDDLDPTPLRSRAINGTAEPVPAKSKKTSKKRVGQARSEPQVVVTPVSKSASQILARPQAETTAPAIPEGQKVRPKSLFARIWEKLTK